MYSYCSTFNTKLRALSEPAGHKRVNRFLFDWYLRVFFFSLWFLSDATLHLIQWQTRLEVFHWTCNKPPSPLSPFQSLPQCCKGFCAMYIWKFMFNVHEQLLFSPTWESSDSNHTKHKNATLILLQSMVVFNRVFSLKSQMTERGDWPKSSKQFSGLGLPVNEVSLLMSCEQYEFRCVYWSHLIFDI